MRAYTYTSVVYVHTHTKCVRIHVCFWSQCLLNRDIIYKNIVSLGSTFVPILYEAEKMLIFSCMYARVRVCTHVSVCERMFACMYVCVRLCTCVCVYLRMFVCIHDYRYVSYCMLLCVFCMCTLYTGYCICIFACLYACARICTGHSKVLY